MNARLPYSIVQTRTGGQGFRPSLVIGHSSFHRGSALLAVMWVIALLTSLVATTMLLLREDVDTIDTRRQMFHARMLAEQGLALAAHPDVKQDDEQLLRHEVEHGSGSGWLVEIAGEDGKINPNTLLQRGDRDTLRRIMRGWGLKSDDGEKVIDALLDWVDQDDFVHGVGGAESKFYGIHGLPFNRPFRNIDEMAQVRYMNEVERIYPQWRDWFSVYASGVVDVNEAPAEVLSAITGADRVMAQQFVARRNGRDGIPHTKDDAPFQNVQGALLALGVSASSPQAASGILGVQSTITRIRSTGVVGDFRRTLYAIINRPTSTTQGAAQSGVTSIIWLGEEDERSGQGGRTAGFSKLPSY